MVSRIGGRHVLPHQDLWATDLPPSRGEPLGGWSLPATGVIATLGRLDDLQRSGQLEAPLISGARLAESVLILTDHAQGKLPDFRGHHTHLGADFRMLLCMSSSSVSSSSGGVRPDASGQR